MKITANTSSTFAASRTEWPHKATSGWNASTNIQQNSSKTQSNNCNDEMGHDPGRQASRYAGRPLLSVSNVILVQPNLQQEHGPYSVQPFKINANVWTMERGERYGVGNGLDIEHADVVADGVDKIPARDVVHTPDTTNKDKK